MSKRKQKTFVIRGFDFTKENFTAPTGNIEDKPTFKEIVIPVQHSRYAGVGLSLTTLLTDPEIGSMTIPMILAQDHFVDIIGDQDPAARASENVISIIDLSVNLNLTDKLEVRAIKTDIREIFKHWAEKSRVKNRRGFRSSAIRTPEFVYHEYFTEVKVQVILSNAIIYSGHSVNVTPLDQATVTADLALLKKELLKRLDWKFDSLSYDHSLIGEGTA